MELLLATATAILGIVAYKYQTRKKRVPELSYPDANDAHVLSYSDEYIRVMNDRWNAHKETERPAI